MGADHPQGKKVQPTGFCVSIQVKDAAEAERIFKALSEGGKVQMAFQKTFWSPGFGMCTDKFDIPWMVNCVQRHERKPCHFRRTSHHKANDWENSQGLQEACRAEG